MPGLQTLNRKLRIDLNTRKAFLQAIRFGLLREHFVPKGVQVFVHAEDGIRIRSGRAPAMGTELLSIASTRKDRFLHAIET